MAIKPNDCVIKIKDLIVGYHTVTTYDGRLNRIEQYAPYWEKFMKHVKDNANWKTEWDALDKSLERELTKFNATYKVTKKWDDRYIKFATHGDLTYFVLKWS